MLEAEIRRRKADKNILLMTHIVLGYPSLDASRHVYDQLVEFERGGTKVEPVNMIVINRVESV